MIYLTPIQITYYPSMIFQPKSSKSQPIFMIRSTLQDIYPAIDNLSAAYNRISYTCIYLPTYGCV